VTPLLLAAAVIFAHGSAATPTIPDCFTQVVAPRELTLACGDGNFWLGALRWRGWGGATATAVGTAHANDCKPYCAAGRFHAYPVAVDASRPTTCLGGRRQYTRLSLRHTGASRPGVGATETESFPCTWPLHPGLTARRAGGAVVLSGTAWGARADGCPATVALASGTTTIAKPPVSANGGFRVLWRATPGRHVVVARQTCRDGSLREAAVVVR
jgi:hypothetical protein